jgi:hypothetical protein
MYTIFRREVTVETYIHTLSFTVFLTYSEAVAVAHARAKETRIRHRVYKTNVNGWGLKWKVEPIIAPKPLW